MTSFCCTRTSRICRTLPFRFATGSSRCERGCSRHEHLLYRWFPNFRPIGLVDLTPRVREGFQAYLYGDRLPYYSRKQHLHEHPTAADVAIEPRTDLLAILERNEAVGPIATSAGGLGKTRLALEIAYLAEAQGWVVLRLSGGFRVEALERLRQRVRPEAAVAARRLRGDARRVYVSRKLTDGAQPRSRLSLSFRCKLPDHLLVGNLASSGASAHRTWRDSGCISAGMARILSAERGRPRACACGRPNFAQRPCRCPRRAGFRRLHGVSCRHASAARAIGDPRTSKPSGLRALGTRRLRMAFRMPEDDTALGNLAALLPLGEATIARLSSPERQVHAVLAQDGWIERHDLAEVW